MSLTLYFTALSSSFVHCSTVYVFDNVKHNVKQSPVKLKFSHTVVNSTHISTFTMDLNPVWTVNCLHNQIISCSLCTVPYQDKPSCCMCSLSYHYAFKFWCWNTNVLKALYTMSENYQTFEFHNTVTKNIYQTHNSTCQNSFLSYHSLSVFITHISCASIVRETWEANFMNTSIIFQRVTAEFYVVLVKCSPLPLQTVSYVMSHLYSYSQV
jgi:hypothetical protein